MKIGFSGEEEPLFDEMLHLKEPTTTSSEPSSSRSSAAFISTSHQASPIPSKTPSPVPSPPPLSLQSPYYHCQHNLPASHDGLCPIPSAFTPTG